MARQAGRIVAWGLLGALAGLAGLLFAADASTAAWWEGDPAAVLPLARTVASRAATGAVDVETGLPLFDAEWTLVTCQMTAIGLSQVLRSSPEQRPELLPGIRACAARLVDPTTRQMGTERWREDGWSEAALSSDRGHAYLGWLAMGLSAARAVDPAPPWADAHDRLIRGLDNKMHQPASHFETYPGEVYPADVAAVIAAVALHAEVTGQPANNLDRFLDSYRDAFHHPSGWLRHVGAPGAPHAAARGATTAVAAWFLGLADPVFSRELYEAHAASGARSFLGFGGMREHPPGTLHPVQDMDSGPVVFGMGVAATGFSLAGARQHGDVSGYRARLRTARLVGVWTGGDSARFTVGGPLGDALLLAALTAEPL